jgi:segregation and condensation protein A
VSTNFSIKTDVFEGPLELLLDLVERRKLLINDISLASVTDEYMAAVSQMQEMSLPGTANFVALAATLLLIKSKSLLPVLELSEEEESSIEELEERLRLYQIYRVAAAGVIERFGTAIMHERQYVADKKPLFVPDKFCESKNLYEAMIRVIKELPIKLERPKVQVRKVISLEEMIDKLHQRIESQLKVRFSDFIAGTDEPHILIVSFLAVLESVKQGSILVSQISRFEEIEIEYASPQLPRYR